MVFSPYISRKFDNQPTAVRLGAVATFERNVDVHFAFAYILGQIGNKMNYNICGYSIIISHIRPKVENFKRKQKSKQKSASRV